MRALVALAMLGLAACSSTAPAPVVQGRTSKHAATGPAPTIAFAGSRFAFTRLPAVVRSRDFVVLAIEDSDSGRGNANLRLEIRDPRDKLGETVRVLAANEFDALVPDGEHAGPLLEQRIKDANRKLTTLHANYGLVPMQLFETAGTSERTTPVEGDGLVVTFSDDNQLRVRAGARVVATVDGTAWLAPPGPRCAQCPPCENPAWLGAMFKSPGIDLIVVRISYAGTDTCWEPPDQLHVVAW